MPKPFLENSSDIIKPINCGLRGLIAFPKVFVWKINVIVRLEFQLGYTEGAVHHVFPDATRTPQIFFEKCVIDLN